MKERTINVFRTTLSENFLRGRCKAVTEMQSKVILGHDAEVNTLKKYFI